MPDLKELAIKEKKIDVSTFFGGEDAYLVIKKLPRKYKLLVEMLSVETVSSKWTEELIKNPDYKNLESDEIGIKYIELVKSLDKDEKLKTNDALTTMQNIYLDNGVDEKKHNFMNGKKKWVIDQSFWTDVSGLSGFIDYVIEQIKDFTNQGYVGKPKGKESITQ